MLEELVVENYALIENVRVGFTNGLNILTGETGAGKSILVGALGLLLGLKADTAQIRTGADELRVAGIANVKGNPDAQHWLSEHGIAAEEGSLILRRTVRRNGKSSLYIQSTPATLRDLRELAWLLFDMHGQHEHQSLLLRDNHRKLLDRFGATLEEAEEYHALYDHYQRLQIESEQLASSERERSREMDFLAYTIQEIDSAHLQADEEQELERDKLRIANAERLYSLLEETHTLLVGGHEAALVGVRRALDALEQVVQVDAEMAQQRDQLQECAYTLEDVAEAIRHSRQAVVFDPGRLEEVNERLSIIKRLEKKYGATVADVLAYAASCRQKLEGLENWEQKLGVLEKRLEESRKQLAARAAELSQRRRQAALDLRGKVEGELAQLGMPKARFQVAVGDDEALEFGPYGKDIVEFVVGANVGEPLKPLRSVASGGELARIMLALKSVQSDSDRIGALIFDEIDAGIGGEIALAVGERLKRLADSKQVLCITHLATIAVRADNHIKLEKAEHNGRAVTKVVPVAGDDRKREVARMLAGDREDQTSLLHAEELLRQYG